MCKHKHNVHNVFQFPNALADNLFHINIFRFYTCSMEFY
jgi:hypothetical protein